jgi:hypothetical protein
MPETTKTNTRWKILAKLALAFVGLYVALTALLFGVMLQAPDRFAATMKHVPWPAFAAGAGGAGAHWRYGARFFA